MNQPINYEENPSLFAYIEQIIRGNVQTISLPNGDKVFSSKVHLINPENAICIFEERYNRKEIPCRFTYDDYIQNENLQKTITGLKMDSDAFWLLVMFCFDYSCSILLNGLKLKETPKIRLEKFWRLLNESDDFILSLSIKGNKGNYTIDDDRTMTVILKWIVAGYKTDKDSIDILGLDLSAKNPIFEDSEESNSVLIWHFASLLKYFFELNPQFKGRATKGNHGQLNRNLLISRLIYYTRLSTNPCFKDDSESLKGFFKQYKDKNISFLSSIYPTF